MATRNYKFRHGGLKTASRGKIRIHCLCGAQSPLFVGDEAESQAEKWYAKHTGLIERKPKQKEE